MTRFKVVHAVGEDWAHAAQTCADGLANVSKEANFAFIYVTDRLAEDFSSILTYLRHKTGIEHWVGSVGMGICAERSEYFDCRAIAVMADVGVEEQVNQMVEAALDEFGRVDILINNAAYRGSTPITEMTTEQWRMAAAGNADGPFFCSRAVVPMAPSAGCMSWGCSGSGCRSCPTSWTSRSPGPR